MIAKILQVNPDRREVTAFAEYPEIDNSEVESQWYAAILKSCPEGRTCAVGQNHLSAMLSLTQQKRQALAAGPGPSGLVVTVKVDSVKTWQGIADGSIRNFDLEFGDSGVEVRFPQSGTTSKSEEGDMHDLEMEATSTAVVRKETRKERKPTCFMKDTTQTIICKCVEAAKSGNYQDLTKEAFSLALDRLATEHAEANRITFHKAYAEVLRTPTGQDLYRGYETAPPALDPEPVAKAEAGVADAGWKAIEDAATAYKQESGHTVTTAQAVSHVLKENPRLYADYENQRQAEVLKRR